MKKTVCLFVLFAVLVYSFSVVSYAEDSSILLSDCTIVIGTLSTETDHYAAERLEYYIERITNKDISVISEKEAKGYHELVIGDKNKAASFSSLVDGSYLIESENNCVFFNGYRNKGTIYAVYRFLEEFCGCGWYEEDIISIPENPLLRIPSDISIEYTPFFEYTEADTDSARDPEFSLANGLNGGAYRYLSPKQGYMVEYLGPFAHTLATYYCSPDKYFNEHPEYFAFNGKTRIKDQLCLTNSDVKDIIANEVLELLEKSYVPNGSIQIVSLTQNDNRNYCKCDACAELDKKNGSQSGTMITFVNEIAQRVKAVKEYPNVAFDTFAYQYSRKAPTDVVPADDVIVRLCSIECCFGHVLDDPDCKLNALFMQDLYNWGKICDRIYVWDYVNNYNETVCIFPNFNVLQRNVQIFFENNVKGLYEEGNYYISECDGEFAEMRTYLLSKLMQDPYRDDYDEIINKYLEAVYGRGSVFVKEFIDIVSAHSATKNGHLSIYQDAAKTLYGMRSEDIRRCDMLWENAKGAAETERQLDEILHSELSWRYWKCANKKGEFSRFQFPYLWLKENEKLHNDMKELGILRLGERKNHELSDCPVNYMLRAPYKWILLYDESYWFALSPYLMSFYNLLGKIYSYFTM